MKKIFFVIAFNAMFCAVLTGQITLTGKVVEAGTQKPVVAASVFISNSSAGTSTDNAGIFNLYKLPAGKITLVVSSIGYETFVKSLEVNNATAGITITLSPKATGLNEVVVTPPEKNGWINWGDLFIEYFIGSSSYAASCRIKNPGVLQFRRNYKDSTLTVSAEEPLVIENKSLGYTIRYSLKEFRYYFSSNTVLYSGYALFEDMAAADSKTAARYQKGRANVYAVSLMHFIRSLYNSTTESEGFRVLRRTGNKATELKSAATGGVPDYSGIEPYDTIYEISNSTTSIKIVANEGSRTEKNNLEKANRASFNSILSYTDAGVLLDFPDDLQVIYLRANAPSEYMRFVAGSYTGSAIISDISLSGNTPVAIMANGSYEPDNLVMNGFWGWWEKIAIMLPYDYRPGTGTR